MRLATFDDFRDLILPSLPGSYEPAVRSAFSIAAREFYSETRAWRDVLRLTPGVHGQVPLDDLGNHASLVRLHQVFSTKLDAYGVEQRVPLPSVSNYGPSTTLDFLFPNQGGDIGTVTMLDPHTLQCSSWPVDDVPPALLIEVSLQPNPGSDTVPYYALTHHFSALEAGTLHRMMIQPGKPYTSSDGAEFYRRELTSKKASAQLAQATGFGQGPIAWRYPVVPRR